MTLTQEITLDIFNAPLFEYINAKQADNVSRVLVATITANGEALKPDHTSAQAIFRATKPDKTGVMDPAAIGEDGKITFALTDQVLAVPGDVAAEIAIVEGEQVLTTATFYIQVEKRHGGSGVTSTDEFLVLVQATEKAAEATEAANKAAGEANTAANKAREATEATLEAAEEANAAAGTAASAAGKANAAAEKAGTAAGEADAAAGEANDAAEKAGTAAGKADTAAGKANDAAQLIEGMTVSASQVPAGGTPTASVTQQDGHYHLTLGLVTGNTGAAGPKGDTGPQGPMGPSGGVASVNGRTGAVTLTAGDVGAYTKAEADKAVQTVKAAMPRCWALTVQPGDWASVEDPAASKQGSPDHYATMQAVGALATDSVASIVCTGGDDASAAQWQYLTVDDGTITLWSEGAPAGEIDLVVTVMPGTAAGG